MTIKHLIVVFAIFLVVNISAFAQKAGEEIKSLNLYIDFSNECVHSMTQIFNSIEAYNQSALDFVEGKNKKPELKFNKPTQITAAFFLPPDQMLQKCKREAKALPRPTQEKLELHAENMLSTIDSIALYCDSIKQFLAQRKYATEPNLITTFKHLKSCERLFTQFDIHKALLENQIQTVYPSYFSHDASNPFVQATDAMHKVIAAGKDMLKATKVANQEAVDNHHDIVFKEISILIDSKAENLSGFATVQQSNGLDPANIYDNFIAEANEFYKESQAYLSKKKIVNNIKGREYQYYNNHFISRFNRYGGGVVYAYNLMVEQADVPILKVIEEANWYKVYPEKLEDVKSDLNKEEILAQLEKEEKEKQQKEKIEKEKQENEKIEREKREKREREEKERIKREKVQKESTVEVDSASLEGFAANNLVFLLDVSSSMDQPEKLPVLKEAFIYLLNLMRPEDYVSIVVYSGDAEVVLKPTSAADKHLIENAINSLTSSGKSNVHKGLNLSFKTATDNYIKGGNNRIILASDGGFEIDKALYRKAAKYADNDIALSIIYLSKTENSAYAKKFKEITQQGKGNYIYVTSANARSELLQEAQSIRK